MRTPRRRPLVPLSLPLCHAPSLSSVSFPHACPSSPTWPPPSSAARRLPASRRACQKLPHAFLFPPVRGIEPGRPQSPAERHFLHRHPSSVASNYSPPALLRPSQHHQRLHGESPVWQDPLPPPPVPWGAAPFRSLAEARCDRG
jgi:hypothetical protein